MIPLRVHNVLDYVIGAVLVLTPYLFGFSDVAAGRNIFLVLGLGLITYSLMTRYYYSVLKIIPVSVHMALDVTSGVLLMLAPSLFGYRGLLTGGQYALHFILGLGAIGLVAFTDRRTDTSVVTSDRTDFRKAA
jgi:hypothetical protein